MAIIKAKLISKQMPHLKLIEDFIVDFNLFSFAIFHFYCVHIVFSILLVDAFHVQSLLHHSHFWPSKTFQRIHVQESDYTSEYYATKN